MDLRDEDGNVKEGREQRKDDARSGGGGAARAVEQQPRAGDEQRHSDNVGDQGGRRHPGGRHLFQRNAGHEPGEEEVLDGIEDEGTSENNAASDEERGGGRSPARRRGFEATAIPRISAYACAWRVLGTAQ